MDLINNLLDGISGFLGDSLSSMTSWLSNSGIGSILDTLIGFLLLATSPLAFFSWLLQGFVWFLQIGLILFIVIEAFIMGFSFISGRPLQGFVEYNVSFIGGILKMIHAIILLFVKIIQTAFTLIP